MMPPDFSNFDDPEGPTRMIGTILLFACFLMVCGILWMVIL